jgi:hypothetical protein
VERPNRLIEYWDIDGWLTKEQCYTPEQCEKATPNQKNIDLINSHYYSHITIIYTARSYDLAVETLYWLSRHGVRYWSISFDKKIGDKYYDDHNA